MINNFFLEATELPDGLLGEVMWDIVFFTSFASCEKELFLEQLEGTAREIIEKVKKRDE